jgi:hypothetical protein
MPRSASIRLSLRPKSFGVSEVIYYRWRQEFGGLKTHVARAIIFPIVARPERRDSAPSTLPHDAR